MTLFELHTHLKHAGFDRWGVSPARLYTPNSKSQTALDYLCDEMSVDGLQALAITKYDFAHEDAFNNQAPSLKVISSEDPKALSVLEVLFENNLDINAKDHHGNNALHLSNELALKQESVYLISQGIDYTASNDLEQTPFDVIPEAAEGFMLPALDKAIKSQKKPVSSSMNAISSLFNGNPVFWKPKKASR